MVSITDLMKCHVAMQSQEIHGLKAAALETESVEKYVYVSSDGRTTRSTRPGPAEASAGWELKKAAGQKVVAHMSPKHPGWQRYRAAKYRASLLLTARLLLKLGADGLPDRAAVRGALAGQRLRHHARRRQARSLCYAA